VNAKKLAPDTDYQKLLSIYESGLNACWPVSHRRSASNTLGYRRRKDIVESNCPLSGVLTMLGTANEKIGANSLGTVAVLTAGPRHYPQSREVAFETVPQAGGPLTLFG